MRILHLTLLAFCQLLLAAFVLYSSVASASPLAAPKEAKTSEPKPEAKQAVDSPARQPAKTSPAERPTEARKAPQAAEARKEPHREAAKHSSKASAKSLDMNAAKKPAEPVAAPVPPVAMQAESALKPKSLVSQAGEEPAKAAQPEAVKQPEVSAKAAAVMPASDKNYYKVDKSAAMGEQRQPEAMVARSAAPAESAKKQPEAGQAAPADQAAKSPVDPVLHLVVPVKVEQPSRVVVHEPTAAAPVVKGGLGPLHLLAATLCSYQPEKPVADETLNLLYGQRASLRKSLFDFMSLKFTNLEKLSSRLNAGLEVMPQKTTDASQPSVAPSHGWPVVGKCTAHDLKLMAEAAWCEAGEQSAAPQAVPAGPSTEALDREEPKIGSNQHRANAARALAEPAAAASVPFDQSAVIAKILHVTDVKDAPVVESSIASLNLTQQQLATIQDRATSTRECRRNALRMTKSLFNHLAEDQRELSDSWPRLYAQMAEDECARKRMIDVVSALSGFRTESTSIRRDNVEFAFAMDDLRSKVLESEVNTPLTFDKQFIEVEQFLQQSVKLMLANIDPERARLTSMRYRSFMPGPVSADDQCIELHQRLLAKNYPTDCNPNQFGQLPDVLRMAASSLELWSIEKELNKHSAKIQDYPAASPCALAAAKRDVNECIANLVTS